MRPGLLLLVVPPLALVPGLVVAHPPVADPHHACTAAGGTLGCTAPASTWGSHAAACAPPPFVGPAAGVFCGPVVPPGGTATCTWAPCLPGRVLR